MATAAAGATLASTKNSDWISSPKLGVRPAAKCGSRSCHGPGMPRCGVQSAGLPPGTGCTSTSASGASAKQRLVRRLISDPYLAPDLVDHVDPPGEAADAVGGAGDLGEPVDEHLSGKAEPDGLGDVVGRHQVERHRGHDAERAERHHGSGERVGIARPGQSAHGAGAVDELQRRDLGRQVADAVAGPVTGGRAGTGDGEMGQRGQRGQSEPGGVQHRRDLGVGQSGVDRRGASARVDLDPRTSVRRH